MSSPGNAAAPGADTRGGADNNKNRRASRHGTDGSCPDADMVERPACGALLTAADGITDRMLAIVRDDDFADPECRFVAVTARAMRRDGLPVDMVTLAAYAVRHDLLESGPARTHLCSRLHALTIETPVPANGEAYVVAVVEQAARRAVEQAATELARNSGTDLDDMLDRMRDLFARAAEVVKRAQASRQPRPAPTTDAVIEPLPEPPTLSTVRHKRAGAA